MAQSNDVETIGSGKHGLSRHFVPSVSDSDIDESVIEVFEKYSHVPREQLVEHVVQVVCDRKSV